MADPALRLSETCRCGASTTLEAPDVTTTAGPRTRELVELLEAWRTAHRCDPLDEHDRGRTGAGVHLPGPGRVGRIGFGAAPDVVGPMRYGRQHELEP